VGLKLVLALTQILMLFIIAAHSLHIARGFNNLNCNNTPTKIVYLFIYSPIPDTIDTITRSGIRQLADRVKSHGHLLVNLAVIITYCTFCEFCCQRFRLSSRHTNFLEQ